MSAILMNKILKDPDDKEAKDERGGTLTLRSMVLRVLAAMMPDEMGLPGEDKFKRYELYIKIKAAPDPVDLTAEETSLLKALIGKAYGPLLMGQAWLMLEGKM